MKRGRVSAFNNNINNTTSSRGARQRVANAQSTIDSMSRDSGYDIVAAVVAELQFQNQRVTSISLSALLAEIRRRVVTGKASIALSDESVVGAFMHMMAASATSVDELLGAIRGRVLAQYPSRLGQPLPRWALANVAQSRVVT
jgi:hypothetical protein